MRHLQNVHGKFNVADVTKFFELESYFILFWKIIIIIKKERKFKKKYNNKITEHKFDENYIKALKLLSTIFNVKYRHLWQFLDVIWINVHLDTHCDIKISTMFLL